MRLAFASRGLRLVVLSIVLVGLGLSMRSAYAHANVTRSVPSNGDTLAAAPKTVIAWFDELPQAEVSTIEVYDAALSRVDRANSRVSPQDPHQLSVDLNDSLPGGTYTVRWTAVSAVDGHRTTDNFVFGVGTTPTAGSIAQPTTSLNPADALTRWLNLLALTALSGALLISLWVLRPAALLEKESVRQQVRRVAIFSLMAAAIGLLADLLVTTMNGQAVDLLTAVSSGRWFTLLTTTRYGLILLVRAGLLVAMAVWMSRWRGEQATAPAARRAGLIGGVGLSVALLFTLSTNSHSAAAALWPGLSLLADWLHLLAVGAWIGGLLILVLVLRDLTAAERRDVLTRFSAIASISVGVLGLTGLYSAGLQLYRIEDLWLSDYGRLLSLKLIVVSVLLLLGLANTLALRPKRAPKGTRPTPPNTEAVQRRVRFEALLGIGVLFIVGLLGSSAPPAPPSAPVDRTLTLMQSEGDLSAALRITPNIIGQNTYSVLPKQADQPITAAKRVRARFVLPVIGLQSAWVVLTPDQQGHYTGSGSELSAIGDWQIQVDVTVDDARDVRLVYPWTASSAIIGLNTAQPRPINTLALGLMSTAAVVLLGSRALEAVRVYGKVAERALLGGIALLMIGWMGVSAAANALQNAGKEPIPPSNPIPANTLSIMTGQGLYQQVCSGCHGAQGLGDGPNAPAMPVQPANLRTHIVLHSDTDMYRIITQGVGAMPAVGAALTPDQRWNLINYLRTLEADAASQ